MRNKVVSTYVHGLGELYLVIGKSEKLLSQLSDSSPPGRQILYVCMYVCMYVVPHTSHQE